MKVLTHSHFQCHHSKINLQIKIIVDIDTIFLAIDNFPFGFYVE